MGHKGHLCNASGYHKNSDLTKISIPSTLQFTSNLICSLLLTWIPNCFKLLLSKLDPLFCLNSMQNLCKTMNTLFYSNILWLCGLCVCKFLFFTKWFVNLVYIGKKHKWFIVQPRDFTQTTKNLQFFLPLN